MNKTIDTETLLLKVESHEHRIGIMENLLRDAKQVLTLEEAALFMGLSNPEAVWSQSRIRSATASMVVRVTFQ